MRQKCWMGDCLQTGRKSRLYKIAKAMFKNELASKLVEVLEKKPVPKRDKRKEVDL